MNPSPAVTTSYEATLSAWRRRSTPWPVQNVTFEQGEHDLVGHDGHEPIPFLVPRHDVAHRGDRPLVHRFERLGPGKRDARGIGAPALI